MCLVIDEAHRATGNYSYCVIVRQVYFIPFGLSLSMPSELLHCHPSDL